MDKIFQKIIDSRFSDFKGAIVDATIPVPQSLINELIDTALRGNKNIESCQVSIHGQNKVSVDVKTTLLPWALNLKLKLDKSVDLTSYGSPKIRAWMENNRLLGSLGSMFNALPPGIKMYGDQIVVDLGAFLKPEQRRMLDLVKSIDIKSLESKLVFDVKIEVD